MTTPQHILIVEDDKGLRLTLTATLRAEGYVPTEAGSIYAARERIEIDKPNLILLDLGLPDGDGMSLLAALRQSSDLTPVIVLTARGAENAKVEALDLGADDYITKPFGVAELLARVRSALRHSVQVRGAPPVVQAGDLSIDLAHREVRKRNSSIGLSRKEFDLLAELAIEIGKPVAHEDLLRAVWGSPDADIRYLRVYIGQLREKLEDDPQQPKRIIADTGYGYRLRRD